jgi:SH3-like domain-containing protein
MKHRLKLMKFLVFCLFVVFVSIVLADTLVIKVKSTNLREQPVFYASVLAVLKAGDSVEKLTVQEGWFKVRTKTGQEGWLHSSSVQEKKLNLLALDKSAKTGATADEVALAGKGFNQQVEEKFKANNSQISFVWVDRMLKVKVSPAQLKKFLEEGKLGDFGGAK